MGHDKEGCDYLSIEMEHSKGVQPFTVYDKLRKLFSGVKTVLEYIGLAIASVIVIPVVVVTFFLATMAPIIFGVGFIKDGLSMLRETAQTSEDNRRYGEAWTMIVFGVLWFAIQFMTFYLAIKYGGKNSNKGAESKIEDVEGKETV